MPDEFTRGGRVRKPQTGAYNNTWGAVLNADALELADDLVTGIQAITLTGTAFSMPALEDGADSDSRAMTWRFTGSPSGPVTVTLPASVVQKLTAIDNQCGQTITFTYGSGTTTSVQNGLRRFILCDGANVLGFDGGADATTLAGVAAANYARRDVANIFAGANSHAWVDVSEGPTTTIDAAAGNHQRLTLTGNRNMAAPTSPANGQAIWLQVVQDATGGRTLTWDSVFLFENGAAPTLSSTANARDLFVMLYDSAAGRWIVGHFGSIAGSGSAGYNVTLTSNECDVNLLARLGSLSTAVVVNVTVATGVVLQALSTGSFALDLAGLPGGSTVNVFNNGYILGRGGRGGDGGSMFDQGSGLGNGENRMHTNGRAGGAAVRAPGASVTCNITNNGYIWGGGGGGGGGIGQCSSAGVASGGGGGGGSGGGLGGVRGGVYGFTGALDGTDGGSGASGTAGQGGNAGEATGGGSSGIGGNGGDWGTAGDAGPSGGGSGGAAGKAVELNGGAVNFLAGSGAPNVKGAVS